MNKQVVTYTRVSSKIQADEDKVRSTSKDTMIRIRKSPNGGWQPVKLLDQRAGWLLAEDGEGGGLWVMLQTDRIHPQDITKLFTSGQTMAEAHEEVNKVLKAQE